MVFEGNVTEQYIKLLSSLMGINIDLSSHPDFSRKNDDKQCKENKPAEKPKWYGEQHREIVSESCRDINGNVIECEVAYREFKQGG